MRRQTIRRGLARRSSPRALAEARSLHRRLPSLSVRPLSHRLSSWTSEMIRGATLDDFQYMMVPQPTPKQNRGCLGSHGERCRHPERTKGCDLANTKQTIRARGNTQVLRAGRCSWHVTKRIYYVPVSESQAELDTGAWESIGPRLGVKSLPPAPPLLPANGSRTGGVMLV